MSSSELTGGDGLEAALRALAQKVSEAATLKVGFFEDATYPDGTSVAFIASVNEFGGTIPEREVPEHEVLNYRKLQADGEFAKGGQFVKKSASNWEETNTVPAHVIPAHSNPPRPFFRRMISLGSPHWGEDLGRFLKAAGYDTKKALGRLGIQMEEELQASILAQVYTPNAQSTIDAKGHDTTLVNSGQMLRSVSNKVE